MTFTDQRDYQIRFEWGERGLDALVAARPDTYVIVDILRFTTCVSVAVDAGAEVLPFLWKDGRAEAYAREHGALLAGGPDSPYSLAVESLLAVPSGTRLVLPSPNGSLLSFLAAEHGVVIAGSLRNAAAVSSYLNARGGTVAVIASGERWKPDQSLRAAFEDMIGAGAILAGLTGSRSMEAESAVAAYQSVARRLGSALRECSSGRQLLEWQRDRDVELAAELNAASTVPLLNEGRFARAVTRTAHR